VTPTRSIVAVTVRAMLLIGDTQRNISSIATGSRAGSASSSAF
jgi:hypothetical protein